MAHPFINDLHIAPPDEIVAGIETAFVIDVADIRATRSGHLDVGIVNGVVTNIKMKRRGTYHGKRYDRGIHKLTFK